MRARGLKPAFFKNELLATSDPLYGWIFAGLWCLADREGRLEDRPRRIHLEINPGRAFEGTEQALEWLDRNGFIARYKVDGKHYIEIPKFVDHQSPHYSEKHSVIPPNLSNLSENYAHHESNLSEIHNKDGPVIPENSESRGPPRGGRNALTPDSGLLTADCSRSARSAQPVDNFPDWTSVDSLAQDWWQLWLAYRRSRRLAPYKDLRMAKRLAKYPAAVQQAAIEESMTQNWQGLFPDKVKLNGTSKSSGSARLSFDEHTERLRQWLDEQLANP